jgi:hypothetical protein
MFNRSPPSPEKTLARVLKLAKFEGITVLVIGSGGALLSALMGDWLGAVVGVLVAGAGAVECHGGNLLRDGQARGLNWLVRSQLLLLNIILLYIAIRLLTLIFGGVNAVTSEGFRSLMASFDRWELSDQKQFVQQFKLFYALIAALTLVYQGGMALYYHRRRSIIREALVAKDTGDIREG